MNTSVCYVPLTVLRTNKTCIPHGEGSGDAVEVIQLGASSLTTWIAAGDDPIPQDEWIDLPEDLPGYPKWCARSHDK